MCIKNEDVESKVGKMRARDARSAKKQIVYIKQEGVERNSATGEESIRVREVLPARNDSVLSNMKAWRGNGVAGGGKHQSDKRTGSKKPTECVKQVGTSTAG